MTTGPATVMVDRESHESRGGETHRVDSRTAGRNDRRGIGDSSPM